MNEEIQCHVYLQRFEKLAISFAKSVKRREDHEIVILTFIILHQQVLFLIYFYSRSSR